MLLVSPSGQNLVLQNNAGDGHPVTGLTLTYDQSAANPIPEFSTLTTGSWSPADYQPKPTGYSFFSPAPAGPYTNSSLSAFNGLNPNGNWLLYVQDDVRQQNGSITGGWSVDITTSPVFQNLVNLTNLENVVASESFSMLDDTPSAPNFTFTYTSTNTALVPNGTNVVFSGTGDNWMLSVFPSTNAAGMSLITVVGTDGDGFSVTSSFLYVATPVNYPPVIAQIQDTNGFAGTVTTVPFTYSDLGYANHQLSVSFSSSNPDVLPASNIALVGGNIQLTPIGSLPGSTLVIVTVSQPAGPGSLSTTASFKFSVVPSETPLGANTNAIVIGYDSPASPYPSQLTLSGLYPNIEKATVTLYGFSHSYPSDVSILLVGPSGQSVVLMSRAGDGLPVSNVNLTFDDAAANPLSQIAQLTTGTYEPTDYKAVDTFFAGPPPPPYGKTLSGFVGTNPNGTWSLYVQDDQSPDTGVIANGWALNIETYGPMISAIGPQTVAENGTLAIPFTLLAVETGSSNLVVSASTSQDNPPGLISSLVITGTNINRTLTITPTANMPSAVTNGDGSDIVTITAIDVTNRYTNTLSFPLVVSYIPQAPSIIGLSNATTVANFAPPAAPFTIGNADLPTLNVTGIAGNPSLVSGVTIGGNGSNLTVSVTLVPYASGSSTITIVAADQFGSTSAGFTLTVLPVPVPPVIQPIADVTTTVDTPVRIALTVTDTNTAVSNLTYSASFSNSNLVSGVTFIVNGNNVSAMVNLVNNASGVSAVTVSASDGASTASQSFALSVLVTPPSFAPIQDVGTTVNGFDTVFLGITPNSTPISGLSFSYSASNSNVVQSVTFSVQSSFVLAIVNAAPNQVGSSAVTIYVSDGVNTVSQSFDFTVQNPTSAVISPIADQTTPKNSVLIVPFTITDSSVALTSVKLTASFSNPSLIGSAVIINNGTNGSAIITPVKNAYGVSVVTISANDGYTTVSQSFALEVLPTPPSLGPIANVNTVAGATVNVPLSVVSPDTALSQLTFVGSSTNANLVSGVTFATVNSSATATVNLVPNNIGTAYVQIEVSDGYATSAQTFAVNVASITPPTGPTLEVTVSGKALKITFTGVANASYVIQSSPDLKNWTAVGPAITAGSNGQVEYDATVGSGVQYYRTVSQ